MSAKEIKSLTGIRGLAAVYVIVFHWFVEISHLHLTSMNSYFKKFLGHGYLAVDLFFVLSGFVLCLSSYNLFQQFNFNNYKSFMFKRFVRIFPLYICITLLFFFLYNGKLSKLLVNVTLFQGLTFKYNNSIIPPGWSLTNEWIIYFLFPFLFYFILRMVKKPWMLILSSLFILILLSSVRSYDFNWSNYSFLRKVEGIHPVISLSRGPASLLRTLADYILGVFVFLMYQRGTQVKYFKYLIVVLFVALCFSKTDILIIMLIPFIIIHLTKSNIASDWLSHKSIYFIGLISYSLYVNHYLFIKTYKQASNLLGVNHSFFSFCYVIIGTIIMSIITYYAIEKPAINLFRRIKIKETVVVQQFPSL